MQKITFYPSIFTAEETNTMAKQIITSIESSNSNDEILLLAKEELKKSNETLTNILHALLGNPHTKGLNLSDEYRDNIFLGGRNVIDGFTLWLFDIPKKDAAENLKKVFEKNGWTLHAYGYSNQSSATNSLINDLKTPEMQTYLTILGMLDWYAELIKSQQTFENIFNLKASAQNKKISIEKKEAQIPVNENIEKLITYLNSIIMFKTDDTWNNIYNNIEGIIKQMTTVARTRRSNQKGNDKDKAEGDTDK